ARQSERFAEVLIPARLGARKTPAVLARVGSRLNRIDDASVPRAAAQMTVERFGDHVAVRRLIAIDQRRSADENAGDAEAALHAQHLEEVHAWLVAGLDRFPVQIEVDTGHFALFSVSSRVHIPTREALWQNPGKQTNGLAVPGPTCRRCGRTTPSRNTSKS